jgi:hypothetical protein
MVELRRESQWVLLLVTQPQAGIGSLVMRGNAKAGKGNFNSQRFRSSAARNQPREGCCRSRLSDNPMLASENDGWKPSLDGGEK